MLKDINYSYSHKHARDRAPDPRTRLEQLISIGRTIGNQLMRRL
jgi:hypothetical protein